MTRTGGSGVNTRFGSTVCGMRSESTVPCHWSDRSRWQTGKWQCGSTGTTWKRYHHKCLHPSVITITSKSFHPKTKASSKSASSSSTPSLPILAQAVLAEGSRSSSRPGCLVSHRVAAVAMVARRVCSGDRRSGMYLLLHPLTIAVAAVLACGGMAWPKARP